MIITTTSGSSIVLTLGASASDVLEIVAFGTFTLSNISINDLTDVTTGGVSDGQVLVYNSSSSRFHQVQQVQQKFMVLLKHVGSTLHKAHQSVSGSNKYFIDGVQQDTLELNEGDTIIFSYPSAHPFALSTTSNGSHGGGSEYTTGVTRDTFSKHINLCCSNWSSYSLLLLHIA